VKFLKSNFFTGVAALLVLKLLSVGLTPADAAGSFFILGALIADRVMHYLFPARPDLFREVMDLQNQLTVMGQRHDEMEREPRIADGAIEVTSSVLII